MFHASAIVVRDRTGDPGRFDEARTSMTAETNAQSLGLDLSAAAAPLANYVPAVLTGTLLVVSGQLPLAHGKLAEAHKGKLGRDVSDADAREAARIAAIGVLAQARAVLGTLDRVRRVVRLGGYINAAPAFTALPGIMNGAS